MDGPLIRPKPDSTYRRQVQKIQRRVFDRTDLAAAVPWTWAAIVAGIWLLFVAYNYLVLLRDAPDKLRGKLALLYGPALLITKAYTQPVQAQKFALAYFLIPLLLGGMPLYFPLSGKKRGFLTEARRFAEEQGRLMLARAAQRLQLAGPGVPLGVVGKTIMGIAQGADLGHVGVFAPARSGKGLHLTCTLMSWEGAAVVVDPKSEQYQRTAAHRRTLGPVYRIRPHQIDLLDFFRVDNPLELQELYTILTRAWQEHDRIFLDKAYAIFEAAHLVARATGEHMLRVVARWSSQAAPDVMAEAHTHALGPINKLTDGNQGELNRFAASAWGTFTAKFSPFVPFVESISTRQIPPDWMEKRGTIFICYTLDELEAAGPLVSAIVAGLIKRKRRERTPGPLLCAIDELPATALPNVDKYLAEVGGAGIVMLLYIQSPSQLRDVYGPSRAGTILANLHHQLFYKPEDNDTADYIAQKFGSEVEVYETHSGGKESRTSYGTRYRQALEPAQLTALPHTAVMVFSQGVKIIAERLNPYNDPQRAEAGFPKPPALIILNNDGSTSYYDADGKIQMVRNAPAPAKPALPRPAAAEQSPIESPTAAPAKPARAKAMGAPSEADTDESYF